MAAKKINMKSVRMTDKVLDYVEQMDGDGFNQKFENMVLYSMEREKDLTERLEYLQDQIKQCQDILERIKKFKRLANHIYLNLDAVDEELTKYCG